MPSGHGEEKTSRTVLPVRAASREMGETADVAPISKSDHVCVCNDIEYLADYDFIVPPTIMNF